MVKSGADVVGVVVRVAVDGFDVVVVVVDDEDGDGVALATATASAMMAMKGFAYRS